MFEDYSKLGISFVREESWEPDLAHVLSNSMTLCLHVLWSLCASGVARKQKLQVTGSTCLTRCGTGQSATGSWLWHIPHSFARQPAACGMQLSITSHILLVRVAVIAAPYLHSMLS